ncbi:MAG: tetratricopeptide repeat protein [Candidatus Obscuribacterales bacterium]|nr:tetratricopeptide repeat protein [Candidatus Obscuribacterales bacterium]
MRGTAFVASLAFSILALAPYAGAADTHTAAAMPTPNVSGDPSLNNSNSDTFRGLLPLRRPQDEESRPKLPVAPLSGSAIISTQSHSAKDLELGLKALDSRLYKQAQERLSRALSELQKTRTNIQARSTARLGLAEAYLGLENFSKARVLLSELKGSCLVDFGPDSLEAARYYGLMSELLLADGENKEAEKLATQSLRILEKRADERLLAAARVRLARTLAANTYFEEAKELYKKALPVLELQPGSDRIEYANALEGLAVVERKLGNEPEANELARKSLALKDDAVLLDKTAEQRGLVKYDWTEGLWGSRQVVDPVYPLKYMLVDGVRVACTLVRSYKHMAVLISLANCSNRPLKMSVGAVTLEKLSPGRKVMEFCDPGLIDEVLEEDVILDRTWRRRTLCHIQKTHRIPGYLRNGVLDPDDFFGNNVFGLYGAWDSNLRDAPPIVTREQYFYDEPPKGADQELLGFMRGNAAIHPTFIETGAARTGVVFFLRDRYERALVRINIGNAELRFPFQVTPGQ